MRDVVTGEPSSIRRRPAVLAAVLAIGGPVIAGCAVAGNDEDVRLPAPVQIERTTSAAAAGGAPAP
jgi:hypothetical protein